MQLSHSVIGCCSGGTSQGGFISKGASLFFLPVLIWHVEWRCAFMLNGILNGRLKIDGTLKMTPPGFQCPLQTDVVQITRHL